MDKQILKERLIPQIPFFEMEGRFPWTLAILLGLQ